MSNKSNNEVSKDFSAKLRLEASQGVGIPFKERPNEEVTPSQNASVSTKKDFENHIIK